MIKIICVGKIKEKYLVEAIDEYKKRLSKYTKLELIEVKDEYNGDILKKEQENIQKYINEKDYIITLQIEGESIDSISFSKEIEKISINYANIIFIIGGSLGLSEEIKKLSNKALSFSKMTFPHQLFRVLLLEQIYRAFRILNNESYHK
ncbi:MAG: 23S rRNA (pseudouridine(1915)-N(3))-methyltransferase RlmH [Bacilli bacterium]